MKVEVIHNDVFPEKGMSNEFSAAVQRFATQYNVPKVISLFNEANEIYYGRHKDAKR